MQNRRHSSSNHLMRLGFTGISPQSSLVWLARGYAVLDGPALPIIAQGDIDDAEPNDTYVQQLVAGAKRRWTVVRRGVADKDVVAVGGHSYGAFMAANLLRACARFVLLRSRAKWRV